MGDQKDVILTTHYMFAGKVDDEYAFNPKNSHKQTYTISKDGKDIKLSLKAGDEEVISIRMIWDIWDIPSEVQYVNYRRKIYYEIN